MSNDIRTRRLVVTLPDVSGEEADIWVENVENYLNDREEGPEAVVSHALGESLPESVRLRFDADLVYLWADSHTDAPARHLTYYEARQLAGALLALPGVADAEAE